VLVARRGGGLCRGRPHGTDRSRSPGSKTLWHARSELPTDLYIPPDALEVFLDAFEGPLDLPLYLIRRQNFNILDIPMGGNHRPVSTVYIEEIRTRNLELAGEYLLMAAVFIEIESRGLLPRPVAPGRD